MRFYSLKCVRYQIPNLILDGLESYGIHTSLYDKQTYDKQPK